MERKLDFSSSNDTTTVIDLAPPPMYKVIFHNDDVTPMDFVVDVLISIFKKNVNDAEKIMLEVHNFGQGVVEIYPYDIAATRTALTLKRAKESGFPLNVTMEKE